MDRGLFMTLYQQQKLFVVEMYGNMIPFGKLERIGKEAMVAYFKALLRHLLGRTVARPPKSPDSRCADAAVNATQNL
jgi:hypothetical protein